MAQEQRALVGLFPAVINESAGIWCATSDDGERWSRPIRLMGSAIVQYHRTIDWPIELSVKGGVVRIVIQHNVRHANASSHVSMPSRRHQSRRSPLTEASGLAAAAR